MAASASAQAPEPASNPRNLWFRRSRQFLFQVSILLEGLVALGCLVAVVELRSLLSDVPLGRENIIAAGFLIVLTMGFSAASRSLARELASPRLVATSILFASLIVFPGLFAFRNIAVALSRPLMILLPLAMLAAFTTGHHWARNALQTGRWQRTRRVAVIGDPARSSIFLQHLPRDWHCVATLPDRAASLLEVEEIRTRFDHLIRDQPVDELLIIPAVLQPMPESPRLYREVIAICEQVGIKVHVLADWIDNYREVGIDHLAGRPLLTFSFTASSPWAMLAKRSFDILAAAMGLLLLSPFLLAVAAAVWISSGRPVLFVQPRCGLRGRIFRLYKFRSMVQDAEQLKSDLAATNELTGPVFKMREDPRVTRLGRWLRRTSIDELPQLWNVLRGEMSLVGPRPPVPEEVALYRLESMHRLAMKPGITGLWQVSGRSEIRDFQRWVALDCDYIRHWSLLLDARILIKTLWVVVRMTGI